MRILTSLIIILFLCFTTVIIAQTKKTFSDNDLVIKLQLTPCDSNTNSYKLLVYGNGKYTFTGSSSWDRMPASFDKETFLTIKNINDLLAEAKRKDFNSFLEANKPLKHIKGEQVLTIAIWQEGKINKLTYYNSDLIPVAIENLNSNILSYVEIGVK